MNNHSCPTTELLSRIYTREALVYTHATRNNISHLHFESTRRFLDITRHIYRRWPYSTDYILALYTTELLTDIFEQFPFEANHYHNIAEGAHALFKHSTKQLNTPFLVELLEYEDTKNPHINTDFTYKSTEPPHGNFILLPYDLESFYISLQFYGRASAPYFLYQQLSPEPGKTYKVYSQ